MIIWKNTSTLAKNIYESKQIGLYVTTSAFYVE